MHSINIYWTKLSILILNKFTFIKVGSTISWQHNFCALQFHKMMVWDVLMSLSLIHKVFNWLYYLLSFSDCLLYLVQVLVTLAHMWYLILPCGNAFHKAHHPSQEPTCSSQGQGIFDTLILSSPQHFVQYDHSRLWKRTIKLSWILGFSISEDFLSEVLKGRIVHSSFHQAKPISLYSWCAS